MSYMIKSLRQANVQKTVDQIGELFNSDQFKGKVPHKEIRAMLNSKSWRRFAGGRGNLVSAWKEFCDPEMGFVRKGTQNWNYVHSRTGNELKEKKYEKIKDYDKNLSKILKMRGEDKVKNLIGFFTRGKGEISIDGKNLSVKGIGTRDQHLIQLHLTKGTGFRKKNVTFESINEELQNSQGEQTDFKKGDVVKDINPDCPHVGSEGEVTKVGNGTITFKVTNNGKNYQEGDELEKTVDQMVKLKESVNEDRDWDLARAGNVAKLADNIIKKMKIVKALHLKGKNKEAKVVLNNKVYSDLDYIGRAFKIIDTRPSESVNEKFDPKKLDKHLLNAINYLKQARKFAKEGQPGAVWNRVGDAKFELTHHAKKYYESVNEAKMNLSLLKIQTKNLATDVQDLFKAVKDGDEGEITDELNQVKFRIDMLRKKGMGLKEVIVNDYWAAGELGEGLGDDILKNLKKYKKAAEKNQAALDAARKRLKKKESVKEAKETAIDIARRVVKNKQHEKGLDLTTANFIVKIYDAYKEHPNLQKQMDKMPLPKMVKLVYKVMK